MFIVVLRTSHTKKRKIMVALCEKRRYNGVTICERGFEL